MALLACENPKPIESWELIASVPVCRRLIRSQPKLEGHTDKARTLCYATKNPNNCHNKQLVFQLVGSEAHGSQSVNW
jgi:hypothetical protein